MGKPSAPLSFSKPHPGWQPRMRRFRKRRSGAAIVPPGIASPRPPSISSFSLSSVGIARSTALMVVMAWIPRAREHQLLRHQNPGAALGDQLAPGSWRPSQRAGRPSKVERGTLKPKAEGPLGEGRFPSALRRRRRRADRRFDQPSDGPSKNPAGAAQARA